MEHPGIVFDGVEDAGKELFWITAHGIGHSRSPMIGHRRDRACQGWRAAGPGKACDRLVMPTTPWVTYAGRRTVDLRPLAETWIRQASTLIPVPAGQVVHAELDPDHKLPDRD